MAQQQTRQRRRIITATGIMLALAIIAVSTCRAVQEPWNSGPVAVPVPVNGTPGQSASGDRSHSEAARSAVSNDGRNRVRQGPETQVMEKPNPRDAVPTRTPTAEPPTPASADKASRDNQNDSEEFGRQLYRCMEENPALKALFTHQMISEEEIPPEMVEAWMEDEDTFATMMKLGAAADPMFREMAGPLAEIMEIQCRWIRENPDLVPWWDDQDRGNPDTPQA